MIRYIGLFILLIPCCVTDLRTRLISVWYVGGFIVLASVYQLLFSRDMLLQAAAGAVLGAGFLLVSRLSREALGMGDAMLLLAMGVWCGLRESFPIILFAFILSGLAGGIWLLAGKRKRTETLPFVPFLLCSCILSCAAELISSAAA